MRFVKTPKASSTAPAPAEHTARAASTERIVGFAPFIPPQPRVLILGSMPSVKSLEQGFYYAHPRNRFFRIIGHFLFLQRHPQCPPVDLDSPQASELIAKQTIALLTVAARQEALNSLGIALYDVIYSCVRPGSLDSNIRDVEYSDILGLLQEQPHIKLLVTNGSFAAQALQRSTLRPLQKQAASLPCSYLSLPSTSPANTVKLSVLLRSYYQLLPALGLSRAKS